MFATRQAKKVAQIFLLLFLSLVLVSGIVFYFYCIHMPGRSYSGPSPAYSEVFEQSRLRLASHVRFLADEIGERHAMLPEKLDATALYIEKEFIKAGYEPEYEIINSQGHRNILVEKPGSRHQDYIIILGAHYDTVTNSPGADDNASGVAVLLELASELSVSELPVTVRFIAFVNEESPFFGTDDMGSLYHARKAIAKNERIFGMYSIEMVGYYQSRQLTQDYPPIVRHLYPDKGDFIAFVGDLRSREFVRESIKQFRQSARIPSEGLIAPEMLVPDIRRSDHYSFWLQGIPAVMITDTANFRNSHYHTPADQADTLNYESMAVLVDGLKHMLQGMGVAITEQH